MKYIEKPIIALQSSLQKRIFRYFLLSWAIIGNINTSNMFPESINQNTSKLYYTFTPPLRWEPTWLSDSGWPGETQRDSESESWGHSKYFEQCFERGTSVYVLLIFIFNLRCFIPHPGYFCELIANLNLVLLIIRIHRKLNKRLTKFF